MLKIKTKNINISDKELLGYNKKIEEIKKILNLNNPIYKDFLGWCNNDINNTYYDIKKMVSIYKKWLLMKIDTVVVIGIGGSYYGAYSAVNMLDTNKSKINLLFMSNNSNDEVDSYLKKIKNKNWAIVVISKSGTTLETSINFKIMREVLYRKYKQKHNSRITCITSNKNSLLLDIANKNKYHRLFIPNNVGGRFSTLTPVGLFPMMLSGINVLEVLDGHKKMLDEFNNKLLKNDCIKYAIYRNILNKKGKGVVEVFTTYESNLFHFMDVYKQLFAESEGKINSVTIPTISKFTDDLHSIGQLYQQGPKNFFMTSLLVNETIAKPIILKKGHFSDDKLSYLNGKTLNQISNINSKGVIDAYAMEGNIPNIIIEIEKINNELFGYLYTFFCFAASVSSLLNGVNPFNQPGVEQYKKNVMKLLK